MTETAALESGAAERSVGAARTKGGLLLRHHELLSAELAARAAM
jgi:hypothetical protein